MRESRCVCEKYRGRPVCTARSAGRQKSSAGEARHKWEKADKLEHRRRRKTPRRYFHKPLTAATATACEPHGQHASHACARNSCCAHSQGLETTWKHQTINETKIARGQHKWTNEEQDTGSTVFAHTVQYTQLLAYTLALHTPSIVPVRHPPPQKRTGASRFQRPQAPAQKRDTLCQCVGAGGAT